MHGRAVLTDNEWKLAIIDRLSKVEAILNLLKQEFIDAKPDKKILLEANHRAKTNRWLIGIILLSIIGLGFKAFI